GLVVGIGVTSRAEPAAAVAAVTRALQDIRSHGAVGAASPVLAVTTWGAKADHRVIRTVAQELGVAVWPHDAATLRAHDAGSARVAALTGADGEPSIGSVARAAVLACGAQPLHDKRITAGCTYVLGWRSESVEAGSAAHDDVLPDPLRHHGDVEARDSVIDLAVNVVVPRPPSWVRAAMDAALDTVAAYPQERPVREGLAAHLGIPANRLLLVNGAAEAFSLVAQARPWRAPLVVHPQFTEPDAALRAAARPAAHHVLDPA
ncbi:MAG: cobalamin biosynthesis protein, partial [Micrococcales bacterium]|nr:cobalamin biosynthesis protein [Micrococcales bacterium]